MSAAEAFSIPAPKREEYTFAELVAGRGEEFPTLVRAVVDARPAIRERIEWLVDTLRDGVHSRAVWHNYTQINRYPYKTPAEEGSLSAGGHGSADEALTEFLKSVELVLVHGTPNRDVSGAMPWQSCGGYRFFLERDLNDNDLLTLKPLREPFLWTHEFDYDTGIALDAPVYEWLGEFSLQVVPQQP